MMPTRLIREGIINSDRVNALEWAAEVFYRRLLNKVDDYGLFDARPSVLRSSLYPLKVDRVREADCSRWLAECEAAGLIVLYEAVGKAYLKVLDTRWKTRSGPKFPLPSENSCKQLQTTVSLDVVGDVDVDVDGDGDKNKNKNKDKDRDGTAGFTPPSWVPAKTWSDYEEMRRKIRKPMTNGARALAVAKLARLREEGYDPVAVLEQSILNSWQGLFPLKDGPTNLPGKAKKVAL